MKSQIPTIVADEKIPYLDFLGEFPIHLKSYPASKITKNLLIEQNAEALLIRTRTLCNEQLLDGTEIKFIGTATSGVDHIDQNYCSQAGIVVFSAPGSNSGAVFQYISCAILEYAEVKRKNLKGLIMGVIGRGHVGEKIVHLGSLLGMEVLINDPPLFEKGILRVQNSLDEIMANSDILTLHVPYTTTGFYPTHYLIHSQNILKMKPDACLINTSRGSIVDESALYRFALANEKFSYILDVWENEPEIELRLMERALIATPHIAGYSLDGKRNASQQIFTRLAEFYHWDKQPVLPEIGPPPHARLLVEHLIEAVRATYDIFQDDEALRKNSGLFEQLRSSYNFRHEFPHFEVKIKNESEKNIAMRLGFKEWNH